MLRIPRPPIILIDNAFHLEIHDGTPLVINYPAWMKRDVTRSRISAYDSAGQVWTTTLTSQKHNFLPNFIYLFFLPSRTTPFSVAYSDPEPFEIERLREAILHIIGVDMTGLYHQYISEHKLAQRIEAAHNIHRIHEILTTDVYPDKAMQQIGTSS
ncbi:MAG: hypothetical protein ACC661_10065 [Verrucomicrobiales bacterium]